MRAENFLLFYLFIDFCWLFNFPGLLYSDLAGNNYNNGLFNNGKSPFKWCKELAQELPYLSRLARGYLAIPETIPLVERLFSVASQVVTVKKATLNTHTVTLLVFLHEALPVVWEMSMIDIMMKVAFIVNHLKKYVAAEWLVLC